MRIKPAILGVTTRTIEGLCGFLVIFLFLLTPKFNSAIVIHSGFCAVLFLILALVLNDKSKLNFSKNITLPMAFFLLTGAYFFAISTIYVNEFVDFIKICISVNVSLMFGWMVGRYMVISGVAHRKVIDAILRWVMFVAIANSLIVLCEAISPEIKSYIESRLVQNTVGLIYSEHPFQLRGLASAGGAGLSLFNAVAMLIILHFFIKKELSAKPSLLASLIILIATIYIGRTGLIVGLTMFVLLNATVLLIALRKGVLSSISDIVLILGTAFSFLYYSNNWLEDDVKGWAFEWIDSFLMGSSLSGSSDDLKNMLFLPSSGSHLIFGIGFFEGENALYDRSDSGYVKTIFSLGLPLSIAVYLVFIWLITRVKWVNKKYNLFTYILVAVMLIAEIKEPFMYQNYTARLILLLAGSSLYIIHSRSTASLTQTRME